MRYRFFEKAYPKPSNNNAAYNANIPVRTDRKWIKKKRKEKILKKENSLVSNQRKQLEKLENTER